MNIYKTYISTKNSNYAFQYLDDSDDGITDADYCAKQSMNLVIRCTVGGTTNFFGGASYVSHYFWQGRIVDDELDQVAEQIYLSNQARHVAQAQSDQKTAHIVLWLGILIVLGIIGFICAAIGPVVVFSSVSDLVLNVGIPILGGIIVLIGSFCSENGHLYGIDFGKDNIQIFLLIWFSVWVIWNAIQAFRHNNPFLALLALASRITTPIFILIIWSWITSAIDRFSNHGFKR